MKIFVGNLPYDLTEDEISAEFGAYGKVVSVSIPADRISGRPRGFAFVEMASKSEGAAAIASLEGKKLRDRVVSVIEALPLTGKHRTTIPDPGSNNRLNKRRERKYQLI